MVEGTHMLRSITIDNNMLKWLASKLNEEAGKGKTITRTMLSNLIWDYEKKGREDD